MELVIAVLFGLVLYFAWIGLRIRGRLWRIETNPRLRWLGRGELSQQELARIRQKEQLRQFIQSIQNQGQLWSNAPLGDVFNRQEFIKELIEELLKAATARAYQAPRSNVRPILKYLSGMENADEKELKAAYRKQARRLHPDVNSAPNAGTEFQHLQREYEYLLRRLIA